MITLHLTRSDDYEGVYLPLPSTPAEIGEAWAYLDSISDDVDSTRIVGAISNVWGIGQYLKSTDVNDSEQFEKLNQVAEIISGLNRDECRIFEGALNAESINSLDDVIAIGERLDHYLLIPEASTDRELGIYLVETCPLTRVYSRIWIIRKSALNIMPIMAALTRPEVMFSGVTARSRNCRTLSTPTRTGSHSAV